MRVGIVTHYYQSQNYGGNLQAYALCKALEALGHEAEQISLDRNKDLGALTYMRRKLAQFVKGIGTPSSLNVPELALRKKAIMSFNQLIPHSPVYSERSVGKCAQRYDVLITGSDQVWHPAAVCDAYLLTFAPSEKVKISYAASVAHDVLTSAQKERYTKAFSSYNAISVREQEAVGMLQPLSQLPIEWVLDPTLLLSREQWLAISTPSQMEDDYVFCYFLADDKKHRDVAQAYAKKYDYKLVTLPHLSGQFRKCDENFGDVQLYDVTPQRLISLIRDAKCVFTDSFHATVFSLLMEKEHFVFQRSGSEKMSSRIYSLASLFDTRDHFCDADDKINLEYIDSVKCIAYGDPFEKYEQMKEISYAYLKRNIR